MIYIIDFNTLDTANIPNLPQELNKSKIWLVKNISFRDDEIIYTIHSLIDSKPEVFCGGQVYSCNLHFYLSTDPKISNWQERIVE